MADLERPKRSAPMSINGNSNNNASDSGVPLSQSCPLKPMRLSKVPPNEPEPFNLPASISEHPSFDEGPDGDGFDLVDNGDELYEYDEHETPDCGPARSLIRNTWQMPDAEAAPVEISAEEFNTSQGRDMFLSQSCPTWGSLSYFPARPSANTADKLDEVGASEPEYQEEVAVVEEPVAVKLSKMSFESLSDNLECMGRSPTIFESLRFGPGISGVPPEEPDQPMDEPVISEKESSPTQDDFELGFEMED